MLKGLIVAVCIASFVLSIINSFARTSSVAVSDAWLKQRADAGEKKAKRLFKLLEKSSSSLIDGLELFGFLLTMIFVDISSFYLFLRLIGLVANILQRKFISIIVTAIITIAINWFIYMVFAIMLPKRIAAKYNEKLSLGLSAYSTVISYIMKPFVSFFSIIAKAISKIFGVRDADIGEEVTEEEIRMMVDIGSENGTIDDDEKQMIHNIFEMDDKPVEEIMTHRKDACILWMEDGIDKWKDVIDSTNHTRYPVCNESVDDVIGIIRSRDFYRLLLNGETDLKSILRSAYFIPDTIKADELLSKMQHENEHMGIVMDEYGGFHGIVTQEDLIEEIVGELYSEYDEQVIKEDENEIKELGDNLWKISGGAEIEDVEKALDIKIEEGDYNTFAGLILNELQTIPHDGEVLELKTSNMNIKVTSVLEHRIEEAIVSVVADRNEYE